MPPVVLCDCDTANPCMSSLNRPLDATSSAVVALLPLVQCRRGDIDKRLGLPIRLGPLGHIVAPHEHTHDACLQPPCNY